jgi:predicted ATPase
VTAVHPLLERGEELRRIQAALDRGSSGSGSLMVIEGPAGIGKAALLAAAGAGAEAGGMQVLAARGAELEREFAFGIVRRLFEPPLAQAGAEELTELLQGAAGLAASALALPGAPPANQTTGPSVHPVRRGPQDRGVTTCMQ